jgi:hypothetical protein
MGVFDVEAPHALPRANEGNPKVVQTRFLRAIGQSLEILRIRAFELKKEGNNFVVLSAALTPASQQIVRNKLMEKVLDASDSDQTVAGSHSGDGWLRYDPVDISWLDARGRTKRRSRSTPQVWRAVKLSQLLRTVGQHLDRLEVSAYNISVTPDSVTVEYKTTGGECKRESFGIEKLRQQGLHMKFRRFRDPKHL